MKKDLTELVFILDRSGSMAGLAEETIGGFNSLIAEQKGAAGEAVVTTVLFDDRFELLHDRTPICAIEKMTREQYFVRGTTALLDAIGFAATKTLNAQRGISDDCRPGRTMVVIITDGMENASREYDIRTVKKLISAQKEAGWEFLFLGANMDAIAEAQKFGIEQDRAVTYAANNKGVSICYSSLSDTVSSLRAGKHIDSGWKKRIEKHLQENED